MLIIVTSLAIARFASDHGTWTCQQITRIFPVAPDRHYLYVVQFSKDQTRALTWHNDGADLWDVTSGKHLTALEPRAVSALSENGTTVITWGGWNDGAIWDARTGTRKGRLDPGLPPVYNMAPNAYPSPDGRRVVLECSGLALCDVESGRALMTEPNDHVISTTPFSPDGRRFVTATWDSASLSVWDTQAGQRLLKVSGYGRAAEIETFGFSDSGKLLAVADSLGIVRVFDVEKAAAQPVWLFGPRTTRDVMKVTFSPDDSMLLLVDRGHHIERHLLDNTSRWFYWRDTTLARENPVQVLPGWTRVVVAGDDDLVTVFDPRTGKELASKRIWGAGHYGIITSPDGGRLLTRDPKGQSLLLWDNGLSAWHAKLSGHTDEVTCARFSPDGRQIATASRDGSIRLWNQRRPDAPWGVICLSEFWVMVLACIALLWSLRRDWVNWFHPTFPLQTATDAETRSTSVA